MDQRRKVLVELVAQTQRLTRIAAQASGNSTPASSWRVLSVLENQGPQRRAALASAVRVTPSNLNLIVGPLEEQRLVRTEADLADDARSTVSITDHGIVALADWRAELGGALSPYFSSLDAEAWAHLTATAEILASIDKDSA